MPDVLPTASEIRESLLDVLEHEDDQGLWEVVWTLNGQAPDAPLADKIRLAREVVLGLVTAGAVELRRIDWPTQDDRPMTADESDRLPMEDEPWFAPDKTDLLIQVRMRAPA